MRGRHKRYVFNNDMQLAHSAIHWRDHNLSDIVKDNLECGIQFSRNIVFVAAQREDVQM
jgi:hypothetical protein